MNEVARETMDADLVIVGAGPAGLACALRLGQLKAEPDSGLASATIVLLEKGSYVGAHAISGALLDPRSLQELLGDFLEQGCPIEAPVGTDELYFLTEGGRWRLPFLPPTLRNGGSYVASLHKVAKWLAEKVEAAGIDILPGFPGQELLFDGDRVAGVRTGDRGVDRDGAAKPNFEPGVELRAPLVILAEGSRGSLTKALTARLVLDEGRNPQVYATGVKEVWQLPEGRLAAGTVYHTIGWPLGGKDYGGGFVYGMQENLVSLGLAVGLDSGDPWSDPHGLMQDWKRHPMIRALLDGGRMLHYGAKTIPEGGYFSVPRIATDGCLVIGDAAGLLNAARLKGIHLAIKSGILAAETAVEALGAGDPSRSRLARYEEAILDSWVGGELRAVRNFRQGFQHGFWKGILHAGLVLATGGRGIRSRLPLEPDHSRMRKLEEAHPDGRSKEAPARAFDGELTFDKLTAVYASETKHEEDQPSHLRIAEPDLCPTRCRQEYGNPCQFFCPASVYEIVPSGNGGEVRLQVNFTNCVHCKTCDIADPYQIITWVPPEGGGGPNYVNL